MGGTLYVIATPIGNLEDITHRALRVLSEVELIACEDTRRTRVLLDHYGIRTKMVSYQEHNESERTRELVPRLVAGANVAIVSDAGTPGICDPGFRLISTAKAEGIPVVAIPGPSALISALVSSGLPTDAFFFGGFLPSRRQARRVRLEDVRSIPSTLIFYEAPHRIADTLTDALETLGEREAAVARELTKVHEEIVRGRLSDLCEHFKAEATTRGEIVLLIDRNVIGNQISIDSSVDISKIIASLESEGVESRAALKMAARKLGLNRSEAYRRLLASRARPRQ